MTKGKLVLVRHGLSVYNDQNRFTGWKNIGLSKKGILEAKESGRLIKEKNIKIDRVYSSVLKRANDTATIAMNEANYHHLFNQDKLYHLRSEIPAITHIDYSARVQSVNKERNPKFYQLIYEFDKITVSRNMKELKGYSDQFSKFAKEAHTLQQRIESLYEDMGTILNRYYQIDELQEEK